MADRHTINWERLTVASPTLSRAVAVIAARGIPYVEDGNRFQTLNLYLPEDEHSLTLVGRPVAPLAFADAAHRKPEWHVHIHGGAWRDPYLDASSIEAMVAHAFAPSNDPTPIKVVASLNYTLSPFPTHPVAPYDPAIADPPDPARDAVHPAHVRDVLLALSTLRRLGLRDRSYVLSGHSCGACLAFQAVLGGPERFGLRGVPDAPTPAAMIGLNGLYDLPALVDALDAEHEHLSGEYRDLLSIAFSDDHERWVEASPALIAPDVLTTRARAGLTPSLVLLDESPDDQLVPVNQRDRLAAALTDVPSMKVRIGHRCRGGHAAPWQDGMPIWQSLRDVIDGIRT